MRTHLALLLLFSALVAAVFAVLQREEPRDQLRFGALLFAGLVLGAILAGWMLYPLPLGRS
jgi:heme A synthase